MSDSYDPFQVTAPWFDGPLDLLLHLVRKQELDINELRLADITEPYLQYVEGMQEVNLDRGGEFLAIAATLIWIKSKTLLPVGATEEEESDPEAEEMLLLQRIQDYQRYKDAAVTLAGRDLLGRDIFPRRAPPMEDDGEAPADPEIGEVSLFALIEAFREALQRADTVRDLHIIPERMRIEDRVRTMLTRLSGGKAVYLHEFFAEDTTRNEIILTFIALLELVRLKAVAVAQASIDGPIFCRPTESFLSDSAGVEAQVLAGIVGESFSEAGDPPETYDA